jgi:hypothetical protein
MWWLPLPSKSNEPNRCGSGRSYSVNERGDSIRVVHPLFHEEGGGSIPTSPLQLHFGAIAIPMAEQLNGLWHSRLPNSGLLPSGGDYTTYGAEHGGIYYAAAIWGIPVARLLNGKGIYELRRFAIAPDAPRFTATRMLGWMVRQIRKLGHKLAISYQDTAVHSGTIYRAAGWTPVTVAVSGANWDVPSRARRKPTSDAKATQKIRWEYAL